MANLIVALIAFLSFLLTVTSGLVAYVFLDFKKQVRIGLQSHKNLIDLLQKILNDHENRIKLLEKTN